ncbi:MAG TPA: DHH family phosphoesterase [Phycisphaerales bacterium]|nr:DHH family phosphoesterase [Phycisphaerales bacterium]HMP36468.1 DHH family phosphoesterase [Phycisphaerales bacterium]
MSAPAEGEEAGWTGSEANDETGEATPNRNQPGNQHGNPNRAPAEARSAIAGASGYESTATIAEMALRLGDAASVVVLSHAKPDGDAVGSIAALTLALRARGAAVEPLLMGPVEPVLLRGAAPMEFRILERDGAPAFEPDAIVVVDTGAWSQLEPISAWLRSRSDRTLGIDHHVRGDVAAPGAATPGPVAAAGRLVEPGCAATTQLLLPVIDAMGVPITAEIATALFMGLATDTGWFRFPNADAAVFEVASRLLAAGARKNFLFESLELNSRPARLALTGRALRSIEYLAEGRAALMQVRLDDFAECGGGPEDIGGLVNEPMVVGRVRLSALLSQPDSGVVRLSLRSKELPEGSASEGELREIDVNQLAATFGGGGHRRAAGAKLAMPFDAAISAVRAAIAAAF